MNTDNHADSTPHPDHPMQPACPAFTRWMQRRISRTASKLSGACSALKQSTSTPNTRAPQSTGTPNLGQAIAVSHTPTPPNEAELNMAALEDLRQRLRCQDGFLQHFMTRLLQEPVVTQTWLTPLPWPHGSSSADTTIAGTGVSGACGQPYVADVRPTVAQTDESGQSVTWVRPIDDIWVVALQAVRDPHLVRHEVEIAFVVTMVQSLLVPTAFGLGHSYEDLSLMQHIKAARQACSDDCVSEFETKRVSNASQMEAQAALFKALLIPNMTDMEAEGIHLLQLNRIRHVVDRSIQVLQCKWAPPESARLQTKTYQSNRISVSPSTALPKQQIGQIPMNRRGVR